MSLKIGRDTIQHRMMGHQVVADRTERAEICMWWAAATLSYWMVSRSSVCCVQTTE